MQDIQCSYYTSISYLQTETNLFQYFPDDIYIVFSIALILTRLIFLHSDVVMLFSVNSNIYIPLRVSKLEHVVYAL